jgi:hypothetical protein
VYASEKYQCGFRADGKKIVQTSDDGNYVLTGVVDVVARLNFWRELLQSRVNRHRPNPFLSPYAKFQVTER